MISYFHYRKRIPQWVEKRTVWNWILYNYNTWRLKRLIVASGWFNRLLDGEKRYDENGDVIRPVGIFHKDGE